METASPSNPFHTQNGASELYCGPPQNGAGGPFSSANCFGRATAEDDFGPETDVDAVDDSATAPPPPPVTDSIAAVKALVSRKAPAGLFPPSQEEEELELDEEDEEDLERQRQQLSEFDDPSDQDRSRNTPTPPANDVAGFRDADNIAADSCGEGDDSEEDEWNYVRGTEGNKENEPNEPAAKSNNKPPTTNKNKTTNEQDALTLDEDEDMESQLNPNAAEFVPVSPTHGRHLLDDVISQSPIKGKEGNLENVIVPSQDDFIRDISKHAADLGNVENVEVVEKDTLNDTCFTHRADESEATSTRAEFGDSAFSFGTEMSNNSTVFVADDTLDDEDKGMSVFTSEQDFDPSMDAPKELQDLVSSPEPDDSLVPGTPRSTVAEASISPKNLEAQFIGYDQSSDFFKSPDRSEHAGLDFGTNIETVPEPQRPPTFAEVLKRPSPRTSPEPPVEVPVAPAKETPVEAPLLVTNPFAPDNCLSSSDSSFFQLPNETQTNPENVFSLSEEKQEEPLGNSAVKCLEFDNMGLKEEKTDETDDRSEFNLETTNPFDEDNHELSSLKALDVPMQDSSFVTVRKSPAEDVGVEFNEQKSPEDEKPPALFQVESQAPTEDSDSEKVFTLPEEAKEERSHHQFTSMFDSQIDFTTTSNVETKDFNDISSGFGIDKSLLDFGEAVNKHGDDDYLPQNHIETKREVNLEQPTVEQDELEVKVNNFGDYKDRVPPASSVEMKLIDSHFDIGIDQGTAVNYDSVQNNFAFEQVDDYLPRNHIETKREVNVEQPTVEQDELEVKVNNFGDYDDRVPPASSVEMKLIDSHFDIDNNQGTAVNYDSVQNNFAFEQVEIAAVEEKSHVDDEVTTFDKFSELSLDEKKTGDEFVPVRLQDEIKEGVSDSKVETTSRLHNKVVSENVEVSFSVQPKEASPVGDLLRPEDVIRPVEEEAVAEEKPVEPLFVAAPKQQEESLEQTIHVDFILAEPLGTPESVKEEPIKTEENREPTQPLEPEPSAAEEQVKSQSSATGTPPPTPAPGLVEAKPEEKKEGLIAAAAAAAGVATGVGVVAAAKTATKKPTTLTSTGAKKPASSSAAPKKPTDLAAKPAAAKSTTASKIAPKTSAPTAKPTTSPIKKPATGVAAAKTAAKPLVKSSTVSGKTASPASKPSTPTSKPSTPTSSSRPSSATKTTTLSPTKPTVGARTAAAKPAAKPATTKPATTKPLTNGDISKATKPAITAAKKPVPATTRTATATAKPAAAKPASAAPKAAAPAATKPKPAVSTASATRTATAAKTPPPSLTAKLPAKPSDKTGKETVNKQISSARPAAPGKTLTTAKTGAATALKKTDSTKTATNGKVPPPGKQQAAKPAPIRKPTTTTTTTVDEKKKKPDEPTQEHTVTTTNGYAPSSDVVIGEKEDEGLKKDDSPIDTNVLQTVN